MPPSPTLTEDPNSGRDETKPPEYGPPTERPKAEWIENNTSTSKLKVTRTVSSSQEDRARVADHSGRCFITNRPTPVRSCHLVSQAIDYETIAKLEYVWEIGHRRFHCDTRHNVFHLRSDWHFLFDRAEWILVPEVRIIGELKKTYLTDKRSTCNLRERFENEKQPFNYFVLPVPSLRDPICRFPNIDSYEHKTYAPPFLELGLLKSHIHPHYMIFNTGQKLSTLLYGELREMRYFLSQDLYTTWIETNVPDEWRRPKVSSSSSYPPGEEGRNGPSQGGPHPRRQTLRSATRSQGQGNLASINQYSGGPQRAIHPFQPPEDDDSSSVTDDTVVDDDTAWIDYIHDWQKEGEGVADSLESNVLNDSHDKQLAAYIKEHARTPPSPGVWDRWELAWDDQKTRYPSRSDRAQFSSNDWAVFKNDVYLTRPDHFPWTW